MQDICTETETFQPIWENRTDSDSMEKKKQTQSHPNVLLFLWFLSGEDCFLNLILTWHFLAVLNPEALPSQLEVKMILCGSFSFFAGITSWARLWWSSEAEGQWLYESMVCTINHVPHFLQWSLFPISTETAFSHHGCLLTIPFWNKSATLPK